MDLSRSKYAVLDSPERNAFEERFVPYVKSDSDSNTDTIDSHKRFFEFENWRAKKYVENTSNLIRNSELNESCVVKDAFDSNGNYINSEEERHFSNVDNPDNFSYDYIISKLEYSLNEIVTRDNISYMTRLRSYSYLESTKSYQIDAFLKLINDVFPSFIENEIGRRREDSIRISNRNSISASTDNGSDNEILGSDL